MMELAIAIVNLDFSPLISYLLLSLFAIFIYQPIKSKRLLVNPVIKPTTWLLFLSSILFAYRYSRMYKSRLIVCALSFCVVLLLTYFAGYTFVYANKKRPIQTIKAGLAAIAVGCVTHAVLNSVINLGVMRESIQDIFAGGMAATNLGASNTFLFALLPCLLITKRKRIKIIGLVFVAIGLVYSFILGTRTQLFALIILSILCFFIYVRRKYRRGLPLKVILKWVLWVGGVFLILFAVIHWDIGGLKTKFLGSNIVLRYGYNRLSTQASDDVRFQRFLDGIANLYERPLGGNMMSGYYHNYWLDIGRVAGVIPVAMTVIADIIFISHMFAIFKNITVDEEVRYALLGIYVAFMLNFMMEPIMDGYLGLLYRFTFINGMTEAIYDLYCYKRKRIYPVDQVILNQP